jgi:hypothetical protein
MLLAYKKQSCVLLTKSKRALSSLLISLISPVLMLLALAVASPHAGTILASSNK